MAGSLFQEDLSGFLQDLPAGSHALVVLAATAFEVVADVATAAAQDLGIQVRSLGHAGSAVAADVWQAVRDPAARASLALVDGTMVLAQDATHLQREAHMGTPPRMRIVCVYTRPQPDLARRLRRDHDYSLLEVA